MNARPKRFCRPACWQLAALFALLACGCNVDLESYYGSHQLPTRSASVNGTDVLAGMFREAGYEVYFRRTLVTAQMDSADTVVWFPDDFAAPSEEVCEWFENWLYANPGRTLVLVGRDFDAAPVYFAEMLPRVGADQKRAYEVRKLDAELMSKPPPNPEPEDLECLWFRYEPGKKMDVTQLGGPWGRGIDAAKTQIQLRTRMVPERSVRRLLTSRNELLASRLTRRDWDESQILLVANGSFLLNLPLVRRENRKLAGELIAAVGEPGRVVFLESGPGGPPIDPASTDNSLWTLFGAWPLNVILLQLAAAGVIFCFARWPIFGRPRQPAAASTSDFGLHVEAVGQLLSRTKDRQYALARLAHAEDSPAAAPERRTKSAPAAPRARRAPPNPERKGK